MTSKQAAMKKPVDNALSESERKRPQGLDDRIINGGAFLLALVTMIVIAYPLVFVLSASFSDPLSVARGEVLLFPADFTLDGYKTILEYQPIWIGYRNTIFYTVVGTAINMIVTLPCAYALSRKDLVGRNVIMMLFTFTMFFSGGMIPNYLLMKNLGLLNTAWAMLLPEAMTVYNLIIARTYFQNSIPIELQEAAQIDGCSNTRLFFNIVLPLSMPIIAVVLLFYSVGHWNSFFNALIYLTNEKLFPLQLFLRNILLEDMMLDMMSGDSEAMSELIRRLQLRESMKYGIVVVSSLPVLVIYPFLQRYFVKGVMIGAVKG